MTEPRGTADAGDTGDQPGDGEHLTPWAPVPPVVPPPVVAPPAALPGDAALTPAAGQDASTSGTDQPQASVYVPPPAGMAPGGVMPGGVMPPPSPSEVPTSAWIATPVAAPPAKRSGRAILSAIIGGIVVVAIIGYFAANQLGIIGDKGKVLFGTAAGSDLCSVSNQTDTVRTTDPIFFAAVLKHHMDGNQAITFHITKDGADFVTHEEPADGTAFDCYGNRDSLGALEPGSYVFEVLHNGELEATGKLTVK